MDARGDRNPTEQQRTARSARDRCQLAGQRLAAGAALLANHKTGSLALFRRHLGAGTPSWQPVATRPGGEPRARRWKSTGEDVPFRSPRPGADAHRHLKRRLARRPLRTADAPTTLFFAPEGEAAWAASRGPGASLAICGDEPAVCEAHPCPNRCRPTSRAATPGPVRGASANGSSRACATGSCCVWAAPRSRRSARWAARPARPSAPRSPAGGRLARQRTAAGSPHDARERRSQPPRSLARAVPLRADSRLASRQARPSARKRAKCSRSGTTARSPATTPGRAGCRKPSPARAESARRRGCAR